MKLLTTLETCICLLLAATMPLLAQQEASGQSQRERLTERRREKSQNLTPAQVSRGEARIRGLEKARFPSNIFVKGFHGIRPVVGGMPSGSGLVGGVGYVRGLESELFTVATSAAYSTRGFIQVNARLDLPTAQSGRPVRGFVTAAYQDYPQLRFFGVGEQ